MLGTLRKSNPETLGLAAVLVVSGCFFALTSPESLSSPILVAGFIIIYAAVYLTIRLVLRITGLSGALSPPAQLIICAGGAGLAVVFLAMQSIGQLTLRDVITISILFGAGSFYFLRARRVR